MSYKNTFSRPRSGLIPYALSSSYPHNITLNTTYFVLTSVISRIITYHRPYSTIRHANIPFWAMIKNQRSTRHPLTQQRYHAVCVCVRWPRGVTSHAKKARNTCTHSRGFEIMFTNSSVVDSGRFVVVTTELLY